MERLTRDRVIKGIIDFRISGLINSGNRDKDLYNIFFNGFRGYDAYSDYELEETFRVCYGYSVTIID